MNTVLVCDDEKDIVSALKIYLESEGYAVECAYDGAQALALLEQWGLAPEELLKTIERTHVFTHVEWNMRCYYIRVSAPGGDLTWVDGARFAQDIALPTAFRMFWQTE